MASHDVKHETEFSKNLSSMLCANGNNNRYLDILRSESVLIELTRETLYGDKVLATGSWVEGSFIRGSDVDEMVIDTQRTVVMSAESELASQTTSSENILVADMNETRPGFTRLAVRCSNTNTSMSNTTKLGEVLYLSSSSYLNDKLNRLTSFPGLKPTTLDPTPDYFLHGPCTSSIVRNPKDLDYDLECDYAHALECAEWPCDAKEWITRERSTDWPSVEFRTHLSQLPCHTIPVGDATSKHQDIEWRFAFVCPERELFWNFNDGQMQTYLLLKMLKKVHIETRCPDTLNSFLIKTALYWISEDHGIHFFQPENLIENVRACIGMIAQCIEANFFPHYFLRTRNILHGKLESQQDKETLILLLNEILQNTKYYVLNSLVLLGGVFGKFVKSLSIEEFEASFLDLNSEVVSIFPVVRTRQDTWNLWMSIATTLRHTVQSPCSLEKYQCLSEKMMSISTVNEKLCTSVKKFVNIRQAFQQLFEHIDTKLKDKHCKTDAAIEKLFVEGADIDGFSGMLYLATYFFICEETKKARRVIESLLQRTETLFYCGARSEKYGIQIQSGKATQVDDAPFLISQFPDGIALDTTFTSQDLLCVPEAVQFECALMGPDNMNANYCYIHPLVYTYFLMFLISYKTNDRKEMSQCLDHLLLAVKDTKGGRERNIGWNLLGHCLYKVGQVQDAYEAYLLSLRESSSVKNAACYHLCILIIEQLKCCPFANKAPDKKIN